MRRHRPKPLFLTLAAIFVTAFSFLLAHFLQIRFLYAYLIGINLTTLVSYDFDKHQAVHNHSRIPEIVLHLLALAGGSPAALGAQITFRHKTKKRIFRIISIAIVLIQLAVVSGILFLKMRVTHC
ncbi:MAG: hypothetical protein DRP52_00330 [Planctomycetota bacterium]|nr:MAG: hypothetical protein DRP52_00330 [Planctomycetota bacterium]